LGKRLDGLDCDFADFHALPPDQHFGPYLREPPRFISWESCGKKASLTGEGAQKETETTPGSERRRHRSRGARSYCRRSLGITVKQGEGDRSEGWPRLAAWLARKRRNGDS
jgi:hypothetical protein